MKKIFKAIRCTIGTIFKYIVLPLLAIIGVFYALVNSYLGWLNIQYGCISIATGIIILIVSTATVYILIAKLKWRWKFSLSPKIKAIIIHSFSAVILLGMLGFVPWYVRLIVLPAVVAVASFAHLKIVAHFNRY